MYRAWSHSNFFPNLILCGEDEYDRWIECEYVAEDATANIERFATFSAF